MLNKLFNLKAAILAFEIAFIFCFFTGVFWNYSDTWNPYTEKARTDLIKRFDDEYWFYINRGEPVAWNGVSLADKKVDFPIVKMPLSDTELRQGTLYEKVSDAKFVKIANLRVLIPLFLVAFLIAYPLSYPFAKAMEENPKLKLALYPVYGTLFLLCLFLYLEWFPRV